MSGVQAGCSEIAPLIGRKHWLLQFAVPSAADMFVRPRRRSIRRQLRARVLFGFVARAEGQSLTYEKRWAFTPEQKKVGFEWVVDENDPALERQIPQCTSYHFRIVRNCGLQASSWAPMPRREDEIDRMLFRAKIFVDLHTICKQAVRARSKSTR